jgi:anti-sigma B factor antagonist
VSVTGPHSSARRLRRGELHIVAVSGEIDMATASELESVLEAAADEARAGIVIDLLDVSFMDSSGLGAMIAVRQRHPDLEIAVITDEGMVQKLLKTTGMDRLFDIVHSVSELAP